MKTGQEIFNELQRNPLSLPTHLETALTILIPLVTKLQGSINLQGSFVLSLLLKTIFGKVNFTPNDVDLCLCINLLALQNLENILDNNVYYDFFGNKVKLKIMAPNGDGKLYLLSVTLENNQTKEKQEEIYELFWSQTYNKEERDFAQTSVWLTLATQRNQIFVSFMLDAYNCVEAIQKGRLVTVNHPNKTFGQKTTDLATKTREANRLFRALYSIILFGLVEEKKLSVSDEVLTEMLNGVEVIKSALADEKCNKEIFFKTVTKHLTSGLKYGNGFGTTLCKLYELLDLASSLFPFYTECKQGFFRVLHALDNSTVEKSTNSYLLLPALLLWPAFNYFASQQKTEDLNVIWNEFVKFSTVYPKNFLEKIQYTLKEWVSKKLTLETILKENGFSDKIATKPSENENRGEKLLATYKNRVAAGKEKPNPTMQQEPFKKSGEKTSSHKKPTETFSLEDLLKKAKKKSAKPLSKPLNAVKEIDKEKFLGNMQETLSNISTHTKTKSSSKENTFTPLNYPAETANEPASKILQN